jgi:hypothetical protein
MALKAGGAPRRDFDDPAVPSEVLRLRTSVHATSILLGECATIRHNSSGGGRRASLTGLRERAESAATVQTAMFGQLPFTMVRDAIFTHPTAAEGLTLLLADVATSAPAEAR